jgi:hypothetical protein
LFLNRIAVLSELNSDDPKYEKDTGGNHAASRVQFIQLIHRIQTLP